jgi:hypothetical protein
VPIIAADERSGAYRPVEQSPVWMTAAEAIRWVARGERRFFGGVNDPGLDAALPPVWDAEELLRACESVTYAVRDEQLAVYGYRTIDGRREPAAVAEKLDSLLFLGGRMICLDGCVRQTAPPGAASEPEFDRVHFRRAEVLSLWPERLLPDVVRPGEPARVTNARRRAEIRGRHARRFAEKQRHKREWVSFEAIADSCARERGSIRPDEELRSAAYEQLRLALASGAFNVGGKSRVLFFGDNVSWVRMTCERLAHIEACFDREIVDHGFLGPCWVPQQLAGRWFDERNLPRPRHLFPPVTGGGATGQRRRKAPSGVNYEASDAPLIREMKELIVSGQAKNRWDAALAVSRKAKGDGTEVSKTKRLHGRYSAVFSR